MLQTGPGPEVSLRMFRLVSSFSAALACLGAAAGAERIRAFCIDFNWGPGGINGFAGPGVWADASPKKHVAWYKALGCNTVQTFAVSSDGYAWYKGGSVPAQPGLKSDFLTEVVALGHKAGMKVMGYFCVGANTRWGLEHPDLSYGTPAAPHIPFTTEYLDFLSASIADVLRRTHMDGFMIDWVWCPVGPDGHTKWLPCERQMYGELMHEPFPGTDRITPARELEFQRAAIERCWTRIHAATKAVDPRCTIWLSCGDVASPQVANSRMFREVDWLMNEATDPRAMQRVRAMKGPRTRLVQCVVGWGAGHDARKIVLDPANRDLGIYGFSPPGPDSLPLPVETYRSKPISAFQGNDRNIAVLARYYTGASVEEVVEPSADASVRLMPDTVTILGESPVVSEGQIGNWEDGRDSLRWRFRVPAPGLYELTATYACIPSAAGHGLDVRVGGGQLAFTSQATGQTWRDYKSFPLGRVDLRAGEQVLEIHTMHGKLWKPVSLRELDLAPVPTARPAG